MGKRGTNGADTFHNTPGNDFIAGLALQPPALTPPWFTDIVYMRNKAVECGLSGAALQGALEASGFYGEEGDYLHFIQHGQWEDVSPVATFDANFYYKSKAADFFTVTLSQVTISQAQAMKDAIHKAGMNAWSHYQQYGTREGIDGNANFDTSAYMAAKLAQVRQNDPGCTLDKLCDAFAQAGVSAAAHYEAYGRAEGLQAVSVPGSAPATPTTPRPDPVTFTATFMDDSVTFHNGIADTFSTAFGTGRTPVQSWDLTDVTVDPYESLWIGDSELLFYDTRPYLGGDPLFTNRSGSSLFGEALAERVVANGISPWGWNMSSAGAALTFTATSVPHGPYYSSLLDSLYGAYPYDTPYYYGYYLHLSPSTVVKGAIGASSRSDFWYSNYYDAIYCDTIAGFNPAEDHIDVPAVVNALVRGGTLNSLSELLGPMQIDANQAKMFTYGNEYYLLVNDADKTFDINVDITIKLAGLGDADAASMTASVFI